MTYGQRLEMALQLAEQSRASLAKELDISVQAVGQVITGGRSKNQMFTADKNARAAIFLRVDSNWLATGVGSPRGDNVWPFVRLKREVVLKLPANVLSHVEDLALSAIALHLSTSPQTDARPDTAPQQGQTPANTTGSFKTGTKADGATGKSKGAAKKGGSGSGGA